MDWLDNLSPLQKRMLRDYLQSFISPNKLTRFYEIIQFRTRHITIVLEDIFQPHNASAVLRTCDVFGIQDVHIIENHNPFEVNNDVALGSSKWLTLTKYNHETDNTTSGLTSLKKKGYLIIATSPHDQDYTPETLPVDQKFALLFGTELNGLTKHAITLADKFVKIPMFGFTESLNISVSAAIFLHRLSSRLRNSTISWTLSEEEKTDILIQWLMNAVKKSDLLVKNYFGKNQIG